MKKTSTLLLLIAALCLQTFAAKHDFKKFKEAVRKSMQAQPSENNSAARATASRKIADVYYDNGTKGDSSHYFYNNNYAPYNDNDVFYLYFFGDKFKYDSAAYYDNGALDATVKITYSNQRATSYIVKYGNEGERYIISYDGQGRFNQYTYDTLTTLGVWDARFKAVITYNASGKVDSANSFEFVSGTYVADYRTKYLYNPAGLVAEEKNYEWEGGQWVLNSKYEYTYNGSGKETLRKFSYRNNSVFALEDSTITTYPQANTVLETRFNFYADTIGGGSRSKTILNAAQKPLLEIREEYYDASTKQWMPNMVYDPIIQQLVPKPDTSDTYTYNSFDQQVYNYYGTDLSDSYSKNYYETYNAISGIEESNTALSATLYPNPVQHQLNLTLETIAQGDVAVAIFNANGQLAGNYNLPTEKHLQLNIAELPAGIYAINIQHSGKQFSSRFIKTN